MNKSMVTIKRSSSNLSRALLIVGIILFLACDQKSKSNDGDVSVDGKTPLVSMNDGEFSLGERKLMEFLNTDHSDLLLVQSLRWELMSEYNPKMIEAYALLNTDGNPVKIVESYAIGNFGNEGEREYYFDQEEVYAIIDRYDEWVDSSYAVYHEKQLFFEAGEPVACNYRSSDFAEEIDNEPWKAIRPENISNAAEVRDLLSGDGRFKTHFISYIESGESLFLLLGEPKEKERMHTAVMIQEMTPFLRDLLTNYKINKFRPIQIEFDVVGGNGEPEFRVLRNAKWAD
jgi:hypothetical protein